MHELRCDFVSKNNFGEGELKATPLCALTLTLYPKFGLRLKKSAIFARVIATLAILSPVPPEYTPSTASIISLSFAKVSI